MGAEPAIGWVARAMSQGARVSFNPGGPFGAISYLIKLGTQKAEVTLYPHRGAIASVPPSIAKLLQSTGVAAR